jgi:hypothetical protein
MGFLVTAPLWLSGTILIGLGSVLAMIGPMIVRRRVGLARLAINNEVAGFKFATVGVLYAVLLAFLVIVVWEKFAEAETDVVHEAGSVATIYRLTGGIAGEPGSAIRESLNGYLDAAVTDEWHDGTRPQKPKRLACPEQTVCGGAEVSPGRPGRSGALERSPPSA